MGAVFTAGERFPITRTLGLDSRLPSRVLVVQARISGVSRPFHLLAGREVDEEIVGEEVGSKLRLRLFGRLPARWHSQYSLPS